MPTLAAHALCSIDEAMSWLQMDTIGTGERSVLTQVINGVTARIEAYLGRQVISRQVTERHDGNGKDYLYLRQYPVVSIDEVKAYQSDGTLSVTHSVAAADHTVSEIGRLVLLNQDSLLEGRDNIVVKYKPGWASAPDDIKSAALEWVVDLYRRWTTRRDPIQSVSTSGSTTVYVNEAIPRGVAQALDPWRLVGASG